MRRREDYVPIAERYYSLGISAVGAYAATPNAYGPPGSLSGLVPRLGPYLGDLREGGMVIDLRPLSWSDKVEIACRTPYAQEDLPPRTGIRFMSYKAEPLPDGPVTTGFLYVSLDVYADRCAARGARIGARRGDAIHWRDGAVTPIPSADRRWDPMPDVDPEGPGHE